MDFVLEHVAFNVKDMNAVVAWYRDNLGLTLVREVPNKMAFLGDASGRVIFEIYTNSEHPFIDDAPPTVYTLHNAFLADDVAAALKHLETAGATAVGEISTTDAGDTLLFMKDPWGIGLQVIKRKTPMT